MSAVVWSLSERERTDDFRFRTHLYFIRDGELNWERKFEEMLLRNDTGMQIDVYDWQKILRTFFFRKGRSNKLS